MDLGVLVLLVSVLDSIKRAMSLFLFLIPVFSVAVIIFCYMRADYSSLFDEDDVTAFVKKHIKKYLIAYLLIFFANSMIPRKQDMYLAAGFHYGQKIVTDASQSEIFQKSVKLLEQKIDEELAGTESKK